MDNSLCLLVTVYNEPGECLLKCALRLTPEKVGSETAFWHIWDNLQYRKSWDAVYSNLPLHVRRSSRIVEVEQIFAVEA
jgi:hypothetical protein